MTEERTTRADAIVASLRPLDAAEVARTAAEKHLPRAALSAAANLAGGESLLWIGRPAERVIRGYWTIAAACMIVLTPVLHLVVERGLGPLAIAAVLLAMALPPAWAAWRQALVRHTTYELTTERLRVTHGILSLEVDDIELYRIKDIHVRQPLLQRIYSLGSIVIWSSDVTLPRCRIHAQPIGVVRELREQIRLLSEELRDRKVVRNST